MRTAHFQSMFLQLAELDGDQNDNGDGDGDGGDGDGGKKKKRKHRHRHSEGSKHGDESDSASLVKSDSLRLEVRPCADAHNTSPIPKRAAALSSCT